MMLHISYNHRVHYSKTHFMKILQWLNKNKWRIIAGVIIVILLSLLWDSCRKRRKDLSDIDKLKKEQAQEIKEWKDKNGVLHSQIVAISASKAAVEAVYGKTLDSLSDAHDIDKDRIKEFERLSFVAKGQGQGKIITKDSIVYRDVAGATVHDTLKANIPISDSFLNMNINVYSSTSFDYKYTYTDSLRRLEYTEKYGFLGLRKRTITDFSFSNKNAKISNIQRFEVDDNPYKKKFAVGPYLGWQLLPKPALSIGLSIQYKLFQF